MRCERYRDALLRAAASGELTSGFANHVEACPECRATLVRKQTLLARMDDTLRARMQDMPSPGFVANVRARALEEAEPGSLQTPMWMMAAASMVVTLVVIAGLWPKLHERPVVLNPVTSAIGISPKAKIAEPQTRELAHVGRTDPAKKQALQKNPDSAAEVLVPPDEREALARFVSHLRQRDEVARAFVQPPQERGELPEIRPVEIARLQVKPLAWESWK